MRRAVLESLAALFLGSSAVVWSAEPQERWIRNGPPIPGVGVMIGAVGRSGSEPTNRR